MLSELERSNDGVIVVVYVHGWKHNADVGNRNVQEFRSLLQRIAVVESLPMRDLDPKDLSLLTGDLAILLDKIRKG